MLSHSMVDGNVFKWVVCLAVFENSNVRKTTVFCCDPSKHGAIKSIRVYTSSLPHHSPLAPNFTRKPILSWFCTELSLLSEAVDAWALPVHRFCRLPAPALQGVAGRYDPRGKARDDGDYEALCSLLSLVRAVIRTCV